MNFDYNEHVNKARIMYETLVPRIDGYTGTNGLPHIFAWAPVKYLLGQN